jgi:hypothetical protein
MKSRGYNAAGLVRFCAAAGELIPMFINGDESELKSAILKLFETAQAEFPQGPRQLRDELNMLISELDLPIVMTARNKDTNEIV